MTFSSLEAALIAGFVSLVVGLALRLRTITPECCNRTQEQIMDMIESLKTSQDIQFRMLRAIVMHLDIPAREKADILNMRPTNHD